MRRAGVQMCVCVFVIVPMSLIDLVSRAKPSLLGGS